MLEFLAMGGYGAFVWSAYAITALVMIGLAVLSVRSARRRAAELEAWRARRGDAAEPSAPAPRARVARRVTSGNGEPSAE